MHDQMTQIKNPKWNIWRTEIRNGHLWFFGEHKFLPFLRQWNYSHQVGFESA